MKKHLLLFISFLTISFMGAQSIGDRIVVDGVTYTITVLPETGFNGQVNAGDADEIGQGDPAATYSGTDLETVVIPASVTDISGTYDVTGFEVRGFAGNETMTSIDLSALTVTSLPQQAFYNTDLETVILPTTVTSLGLACFQNSRLITSINTENLLDISQRSSLGEMEALASADFSSVTSIGRRSLRTATAMTSIEFPSIVTFGGDDAITSANLAKLVLGPNLASYNADGLDNVPSLKALEIQIDTQNPGSSAAFAAVSAVTPNIPNKADVTLFVPTEADKTAWTGTAFATGFKAIVAGSAPVAGDTFNDGVFNYVVTESLTAEVTGWVTLPVANIDVVIPGTANNGSMDLTVTSIGNGAFSCNTAANRGAGFTENTFIQTVTLPASVTTFNGAHQFRDNPNLTSINLENIVETGSNTFANCTGLTGEINLSACTNLGAYTFVFCVNITKVNIPLATSIEEGALRDTGITSINIPDTVTEIGGQLFRQCDDLTEVQLNWADPSVVVWTNTNTTHTATWNNIDPTAVTIWVPTGTEATYEATEPWSSAGAANISEGVLSTKEIAAELGFSIFPNPTSGIVTIKNTQVRDAAITVYDLNGRTLLNKNMSNTESSIDISNLASGLYLIKVRSGASEFTKRILKQ